MKKIITILMMLAFYSSTFGQAYFQIQAPNNPSVIYNINGVDMQDKLTRIQSTPNYGLKIIGNTWLLNGGQAYLVENFSTINSVKFYYRIYKEDLEAPEAAWNEVSLSFVGSDPNGSLYQMDFLGINILDHSLVNEAGKYYLEFYFEAETSNPATMTYPTTGIVQGYFTTTTALPVELTTFSAFAEESKVALNWETATEVNNYGFEIERQKATETTINLSNWEKIGFVEGHGNSNSPKIYTFTDNTVISGDYYYRLRQVDIDGQFEYSDVVEVNIDAPNLFELSQNYPNPFNPKTNIQFSLTDAANVSLIVYNTIGQKVAELINQRMEAGVHNSDFDGSNLNSGIYIYMLKTEKSTLTKKMILMK